MLPVAAAVALPRVASRRVAHVAGLGVAAVEPVVEPVVDLQWLEELVGVLIVRSHEKS